MNDDIRRRRLLAGVGTVALAGCLGEAASAPDLPADCPTTQGLDVEWPDDLDPESVESFVTAYEDVYYREVVLEWEPESRVEEYRLSVSVQEGPTEAGDGFEVKLFGGGGVYEPTLHVTATVADAPDGVEVVPGDEVDDGAVTSILERAVQEDDDEASFEIESPGERVEEYISLFESLSEDFDPPEAPGESGTLYVDQDGTTVELHVQATNFHGDYGWHAWYYVDEHVVRRTSDEEVDPQDGELLECREEA